MIRVATGDDLASLIAIEQACFGGDKVSPRQFRYLLNKANASTLVAISEDGICAYAMLLFRRSSQIARLYSIAVLPAYRADGWASKLVLRAEQVAIEKGCRLLRLEIREDNGPSIGLFKKMDYRVFGRYPRYYEDGMDALRLEKQLGLNSPN